VWCPSHCLVYKVSISNTQITNNLRISRPSHTYAFSFSGYQSEDNQTVAAQQLRRHTITYLGFQHRHRLRHWGEPIPETNTAIGVREDTGSALLASNRRKTASLSNCFPFQRPKHTPLILTTANIQWKVHCAFWTPHFISLPEHGWSR